MNEYVRGVNLGGWLIIEKWMTPTLFKGYRGEDEYSFMQNQGSKKRIQDHRNSFITEQDFAWLSAHGINLVRIPVGYWLFEQVDGYLPTIEYLDIAMRWAEKHGIAVLIDLHGAKGSQNGKNHSGKKGSVKWFDHKSYQADTIDLLERIAHRYRDSRALWGIELLNEPQALRNYFAVLRFYRHTYGRLRKILRPGTHVVFHDGFHAILFSGALWPHRRHPIVMDTHWYAFYPFGNDAHKYRKLLRIYRGAILKYARLFQPVVVGEWSSVFPGRYFEQLPKSQHDELLRQNIDSQLKMLQGADGWIYWNYKHEGGGMWNYRSLVDQMIFPSRSK